MNRRNLLFFLSFLFLSGVLSVGCGPQSPREFYRKGLREKKEGNTDQALKALRQAYLLRYAQPVFKTGPLRNTEIRYIRQNGDFVLLQRFKNKTEIKYVQIDQNISSSKINYYSMDETRDWNALLSSLEKENRGATKDEIKRDKKKSVRKFIRIIPHPLLNYQFGPSGQLVFYVYDHRKGFSIYYKNLMDSDDNSNREEKIYSHRDLQFENDFIFYSSDKDSNLAFYKKNGLFRLDLQGKKKVKLLLSYHKLSIPYPRIGAMMYAYPGNDWSHWHLLLGGGGAYHFHRYDFNSMSSRRLTNISSSQITVSHSGDRIIYWSGGSGYRKLYYYDFHDKKRYLMKTAFEVFTQNKVKTDRSPLKSKQLQKGAGLSNKSDTTDFMQSANSDAAAKSALLKTLTKDCKQKKSSYISFLGDDRMILACNNVYFSIRFEKKKDSLKIEDLEPLPILGKHLFLDEKRERFYTLFDDLMLAFPIQLLLQPEDFAWDIYLAIQQMRKQETNIK